MSEHNNWTNAPSQLALVLERVSYLGILMSTTKSNVSEVQQSVTATSQLLFMIRQTRPKSQVLVGKSTDRKLYEYVSHLFISTPAQISQTILRRPQEAKSSLNMASLASIAKQVSYHTQQRGEGVRATCTCA